MVSLYHDRDAAERERESEEGACWSKPPRAEAAAEVQLGEGAQKKGVVKLCSRNLCLFLRERLDGMLASLMCALARPSRYYLASPHKVHQTHGNGDLASLRKQLF